MNIGNANKTADQKSQTPLQLRVQLIYNLMQNSLLSMIFSFFQAIWLRISKITKQKLKYD